MTSEINKKNPTEFWIAVKSLPRDTPGNKSNCVRPNKWEPYFKKLLLWHKATITRCDLSPRLFCIDATLLCKFESDEIRLSDFE